MKNGTHLPLSLGDKLISDITHFERLGKGEKDRFVKCFMYEIIS